MNLPIPIPPTSLLNIPLTQKERIRLCHSYLSRNSDAYKAGNILVQMSMARELCDTWKESEDSSIEDVFKKISERKDEFENENTEKQSIQAQSEVGKIQSLVQSSIQESSIQDKIGDRNAQGTKETQESTQESEDSQRIYTSNLLQANRAEKGLSGFILDEKPESRTASSKNLQSTEQSGIQSSAISTTPTKTETFSLDITLNPRQRLAIDYASNGKSFVLTGPAGSGKTTTERTIVTALLARDDLGIHEFKDKRSGERVASISIAVVSFTNKAANNSAKAILKDSSLSHLSPNITTIHNLLEYSPDFFTKEDGTEGMRFTPRRNAYNPLDITHIIIEEASNVGALDLYQSLYDALRPGTCIILVGDINQLPPVFSPSILNYGLVQLPVVELTEIYRQALDSPIIANAHHILRGEPLKPKAPYFVHITGKNIPKLPSESASVNKMINSLKKWTETADPSCNGEMIYDPDQDIILSPYNVNDAGTESINAHVAQFLGLKRGAEVYEVLAGMNRQYLAVGDKVFCYKREGTIISIAKNGKYIGKVPKLPGTDLTRWGIRVKTAVTGEAHDDFELEISSYENMDVDNIPDDSDSKKQAASHVVTIRYEDGKEDSLDSTGDFSQNNFSLGYALTVHKSQGSEWRKVFFIIHKNHVRNLNREMLYTAVTRARTHCMIIDHCGVFEKGLESQRVKGNTVEEKIQWFNSKISLNEPVRVLK